jgi:hypothetical protein
MGKPSIAAIIALRLAFARSVSPSFESPELESNGRDSGGESAVFGRRRRKSPMDKWRRRCLEVDGFRTAQTREVLLGFFNLVRRSQILRDCDLVAPNLLGVAMHDSAVQMAWGAR